MKVSIIVTTRNRSEQLRLTLRQIGRLNPVPSEVMVTADGCTDDTVQVARTELPDVILIVNSASRGSVASRAEMMKRVTGDLVFALDDDSYPEQTDCLAKLGTLFSNDDRLAVATFPQRSDEYPDSLSFEKLEAMREVRSFANSGACLRVGTYRRLAGFEPMFFHMYEEPDYALQCVANGFKVLLFPGISIRHHWTPNQRSELRNHHWHARNEFWSTLMRCPFPQAFGLAAYRVFSQARFAAKRGPKWLLREPLWWFSALGGLPQALRRRQPVSWEGYCKWISLPDA